MPIQLTKWDRVPAIRQNREVGARHATWLELFYDLVFVISIAQLAHLLGHHVDQRGVIEFILLFLPLWWIWMGFSYYADQFDTDDAWFRLSIFASMFGVLAMTISLESALNARISVFALLYFFMRTLLIGLYVRTWWYVKDARPLNIRYLIGFSIGALVWLISAFAPAHIREWLWGAALLIETATPVIAYITVKNIPAQQSHMDERLGLFTIIVLGESLVATSINISLEDWSTNSVLVGLLGFLVVICMWSLYFDKASESLIDDALQGNKATIARSFVYGYGHVFVFIGIVLTSVGILTTIKSVSGVAATDHHANVDALVLLCSGLVVYIASLTIVQASIPSALSAPEYLVRFIGIAAIVSLTSFVESIGTLFAASIVTTVIVAQTIFERHWEIAGKASGEAPTT